MSEYTREEILEKVKNGVSLAGADLRVANLYGADLTGADLTGADLRGADLTDADLKDVKWPFEVPGIPDLKEQILAKVQEEGCLLDMDDWHTCKTTHCIAGWAITIAGAQDLVARSDEYLVGRLLLDLDAEEAEIFYSTDEEAMNWLKGGK